MFLTFFVFFSDPPGPAFIQKDIDRVIKGDSITLTCNVAEPGNNRTSHSLTQTSISHIRVPRLALELECKKCKKIFTKSEVLLHILSSAKGR